MIYGKVDHNHHKIYTKISQIKCSQTTDCPAQQSFVRLVRLCRVCLSVGGKSSHLLMVIVCGWQRFLESVSDDARHPGEREEEMRGALALHRCPRGKS